MSNGKLKASTNRVRTSIALQQTSIWTTAIGVEKHENTNSIIEATLNAPGMGGGKRGESRRAAAAHAVEATGGFGGNAVDSYSALLDVARSQGALGGLNRGACKRCGQLGHLTKQCRNQFSRFFDGGPNAEKTQAAAAAAGVPTAAIAMAPIGAEADAAAGGIGDSSSDSMSGLAVDSDSDSASSSDSEAERRRRKERKRKRKERKEKERKRKHKKLSSKGENKKSSSKHKKRRRSRSPSSSSSG